MSPADSPEVLDDAVQVVHRVGFAVRRRDERRHVESADWVVHEGGVLRVVLVHAVGVLLALLEPLEVDDQVLGQSVYLGLLEGIAEILSLRSEVLVVPAERLRVIEFLETVIDCRCFAVFILTYILETKFSSFATVEQLKRYQVFVHIFYIKARGLTTHS